MAGAGAASEKTGGFVLNVLMLLVAVLSGIPEATVNVSEAVPVAGVSTMAIVCESSLCKFPRLQLRGRAALQVPALGVAEMNAYPAGVFEVTVTAVA